jgi:hypothetical protein
MHQNLVGRLNAADEDFKLSDFYPGRWMGPPRGPWFTALSGTKVHLLDPQPDELTLSDMAHGLAAIARFGGHVGLDTERYRQRENTILYTVAQHSVLVLWLVFQLYERKRCKAREAKADSVARTLYWNEPEHLALLEHAVLHDSPEAWLGDKISPLKQLFPFFKIIENNFFACIVDKRKLRPLSVEERMTLKFADRIALSIERELYCPNPPRGDDLSPEENVTLPDFAVSFIECAKRAHYYGRSRAWSFDRAKEVFIDAVHNIAGRRWAIEAADDPNDELPGRLELSGVPDFDQSMDEYMDDIKEMLLT